MRTVVVIGAGGTIASKEDAYGVAVRSSDAGDLLAMLPPVPGVRVEAMDMPSSYPMGWNIDWATLCGVGDRVRHELSRPDVSGVVVTHGTDVLEEVAHFVSLSVRHDKTVVFTGAMSNQSQPGYDGPRNLHDSVVTASSQSPLGTVVVFNGRVLAAASASKRHSSSIEAFGSSDADLIGTFDPSLVVHRQPRPGQVYDVTPEVAPSVPLLWAYTCAGAELDAVAGTNPAGLVLAGTGLGHVPAAWVPRIGQLRDQGTPVLIATRCGAGSTALGYGGPGGGAELRELGVLWGGDRRPLHARMELMCAVSAGTSAEDLQRIFGGTP